MINTPKIRYSDRQDHSERPSWLSSEIFVNQEHKEIFDHTKDIPGEQRFGDTYKLYEMGYFAGDTILEIGTCGGRSAVVELKGALANEQRKNAPQYFGIDLDPVAIGRTYASLRKQSLHKNALLFCGDLEAFSKEFSITPTMVFLDGDHKYEGVKNDLEILSKMLPAGVPVLCHDYLNPEYDTGEDGVRRAVDEWQEDGFADFFNCFGSSVLVVTTDKCKGGITPAWSQKKFRRRRRKFRKSRDRTLGLGRTNRRISRRIALKPGRDYTVHDFFPDFHKSRPREACADIIDPLFWKVYERCEDYSLLSIERFYNIFRSVEHIAKNDVRGDFVECGVFLGGAMMAIALFAKHFGVADRKFYLYDTFAGFPENTSDVDCIGNEVELRKLPKFREVVEKNISGVGMDDENFIFVEGPVEQTLGETTPDSICLLRLDTDYYESTLVELQVLYPLLSPNGVLIIDDYGAFEGARKAVDEYFAETGVRMLLNRIDLAGRSGIKQDPGPGTNG